MYHCCDGNLSSIQDRLFTVGSLIPRGGYTKQNKRLHLDEDHCKVKQDYLFTVMNYENYGGVIRFNHVGVKTKMFQAGGIGDQKSRWDKNEVACKYITEKYYHLATIVRGGTHYGEIRLRHSHKFTETGFSALF